MAAAERTKFKSAVEIPRVSLERFGGRASSVRSERAFKMQVIDLSKDKHVNRLLAELPALSGTCNLVERAVDELDFLRAIDEGGRHFYEESFVRRSVQRYENYWLPFVAAVSKDHNSDENFT